MSEGDVSPELRRAAVSGARWTALARLARETAAFAAAVVLARLISPAEFGHAAIALIVIALTAILGTAGCSAPLVQRVALTPRIVAAVTVLCLGVGLIFTAGTIVATDLLVRPLFGERTAELVLLAAPAWILVAIGSPSNALLQRTLRFRALAVIESAAALVSAVTAVSLAVAGANGEAIVIGNLVLVGLAGLLALAALPLRAWRTDSSAVRETLGFATPLALSSLVYLGYRNVDYVIFGARATATQLGYYWRAFQLGVGYQSKISQVMQRVALPVFSRAKDAGELHALHKRIVRAHATILVPLLATFIVAAPVLVPWLFGSTWEPAVLPAQIMAVAGMAEAIMTGVGPLMVALGRPGVLLRLNLLVLAVFTVTIFVLAPYGIEAVAVGVAGFGILTVVGMQTLILRPYAGFTFGQLWDEIRAGIAVGTGILLVGTIVRIVLEALDVRPFALLLVLGAVTALVYAALLRTLFPAAWDDLRAIFLAVRGDARSRAPEQGDAGGGNW